MFFSCNSLAFLPFSDRCHCLLMFDAVNKTSNDMELSFSVQNGNDQPCGKPVKSTKMSHDKDLIIICVKKLIFDLCYIQTRPLDSIMSQVSASFSNRKRVRAGVNQCHFGGKTT